MEFAWGVPATSSGLNPLPTRPKAQQLTRDQFLTAANMDLEPEPAWEDSRSQDPGTAKDNQRSGSGK